MKSRFLNGQKGFTLPLSMVVLAVGVLTVTPFLIGLSTSLISSRNSQVSTNEQYAVDGAFEDAVWDLKYGSLAGSLSGPCDSISYPLEEKVNGLHPNIEVTWTSDCGGDDGQDSIIYQISVESGSRTITRELNISVADTAGPSPLELKQSVVDNLSPFVTDSKKYGKRFKKAVEETEKSLDPKLWGSKSGKSGENSDDIDPFRLDAKEGKKDFKLEGKAVKELKELLKGFADDKCGGVTSISLEYTGPGIISVKAFLEDASLGTFVVEAEDPDLESNFDSVFEISATEETDGKLDKETRLVVRGKEVAKIDTSCSKPIEIGDVYGDFTIDDLEKLPSKDKDKLEVSAESLEFARMAMEDLLTADRMLAQLSLEENPDLVAVNPKNQKKVDKELKKAVEELAKGDAERAKLKVKPDKVIKSYGKAWERVAKALKESAKE